MLTELTHLNFWSNNIVGELPREIGQCTSLVVLELQKNYMTGRVPYELRQLRNATDIGLHWNEMDVTEADEESFKAALPGCRMYLREQGQLRVLVGF